MKKIILPLIIFLFVSSLYAQNTKVHELIVTAQKKDSLSKYSYVDLHYRIMDAEKDTLRLHTYLKEYRQRAFREKNNERISAYYKNFVFQQKEEKQLTFIDSALPYAFKTKDKAVIGDVYLTKGILFYSIKDFQKALDNYLKANEYISQTDDVYNKKRIKYQIGIVKNYLGYYSDAASLFQECIEYYGQDETYNMQRGYVSSLEGLAWSYTKMNRVKKSNQVLQTALRSVEKNNFSIYLRPWFRIPDEDDENPEIVNYIGRYEMNVIYNWKKLQLALTNSHPLTFKQSNINRGRIQFDAVYPLFWNMKGHLQYSVGYGETMIDYNHNQTTFGLGISLIEW